MTPSPNKMLERLLIVDDEENVVTFCSRTLQNRGYEVHVARSAQDALVLLQSERFDLLATDIKMPGMSGLELMREALALRADLAVIVITGMGTFDVSVEALRAGAHDFLVKPFGANELARAVEHALEQARLIRESARLRLLEPLLELSQQALSHVDLAGLCKALLNIAISQTQGLGAALLLNDPEQVFAMGLPQDQLEILGRAARAHNLNGAIQVWSSDELVTDLDREQEAELGMIAYAPLYAHTGHIGGLLIALDRDMHQVDRGELDLVSLLASHAATLLDNARLVMQLEEWNHTLEEHVAAAQERLLRTERLATVGQLGSSIAHELRNPLGVISNSVYYLKMRLGERDERISKHLEIISREVQTANKIITDLMSFVRVGQLEVEATNPQALVMGALERAQIPPNVRVHADVPADLPPIHVDRDKMRQALLNLVDNAVQAMPDGGDLTISAELAGNALRLRIRDTGEGIPHENLERIFEPLFTTKAKGIGLGLAIVRMMVEAHGGQVSIASELGQGTTFTLQLPLETPSTTSKELLA